MGRYTRGELWKSSTCPEPAVCAHFRNFPKASCEELSAITNRETLSRHVREVGAKRHFHALANPSLRPLDRAWAANNSLSSTGLKFLMANPSLRTSDLPNHEGWTVEFLEVALRRGDLVLKKHIDFFADIGPRSLWYPLLSNGLDSRLERKLLSKPVSFQPILRKWAQDGRSSVEYLEACLRLDSKEESPLYHVSVWEVTVSNRRTSLEALFTTPSQGEHFESIVDKELNARAEDASAWVKENYPEMADVPFAWVRAVLAGGADE